MTEMADDGFAGCLAGIRASLPRQPASVSEWALLQTLQAYRVPGFEALDLREPLGLYRSHFLLFHCLYRLQAALFRERGEWLEIHCLRITLHPAPPAANADSANLRVADPLRAYYLDLANLEEVDAAQVEALLSAFWRRLATPDSRRLQALDVLGLDPSASRAEIKRRYRRLAQHNHPDRGGDEAFLQRLNEAMMILAG